MIGFELDLVFAIPSLIMSIVGWRILRSRPGHGVGRLLSLGGLSGITYAVAAPLAALSMSAPGGPWPGEWLAAWLGVWTWSPVFASLPALLFIFPTGRPFGIWRWPFAVWVALVIGVLVVSAWRVSSLDAATLVDIYLGAPAAEYEWLNEFFAPVVMFVGLPLAVASFLHRWIAGDRTSRQQMKWLLMAPPLLVVGIVVAEVTRFEETWLTQIAAIAGLSAFPLAVGVAVLRYHLYEIDRVISRVVTYALLVGCLGLAFAVAAVAVGTRMSSEPVFVAAATLAVAALFNPLRRKLQTLVDRRFNRSHADAERVMSEFVASLQDRVDPDEILEGWVGVVSQTMQPSVMGVWVR